MGINLPSSMPTPKMVAYAESLASQTGAPLPAGYDLDFEICHNFLDRNAPRKLDDLARDELRTIAPEIIRSILGEPNRKLCSKRQLRWGRKGSFALNVSGANEGLWFNHEEGVGGDIITFIQTEHRCSVGQAIQIGLEFIGGFRSSPTLTSRRPIEPEEDDAGRIAQALAIWGHTLPLRDSLAERYLRQRGIQVSAESLDVLRFHPNCPFGRRRAPALVALVQHIITREPLAIHRRELTAAAASDGAPMSLGPKIGGAIMLSPADAGAELTIGEGIETCLAGMMLGFSPAWSVIDAGGITSFPILEHVRRLTILVDHDVNGTGQRAASECRGRWMAVGKTVRRVMPDSPGQDINDLLLADLAEASRHA